jgi:hypothetical protein
MVYGQQKSWPLMKRSRKRSLNFEGLECPSLFFTAALHIWRVIVDHTSSTDRGERYCVQVSSFFRTVGCRVGVILHCRYMLIVPP